MPKVSNELEYTKEQILKSTQFSGVSKDLLNVLLEDGKQYTLTQCNKILEKEKERVIK